MKVGEAISKIKIPKDLPGWGELTIEERFQREINYKRVKEHIAKYLAEDKDRFFGALIVDIYNDKGVDFEPLSKVLTKQLPGLYNAAADAFGFLNFTGGELLSPLDGQHRLAALQFATTGKDEQSRDIDNFKQVPELADEDITLILVRHEQKKARKIFNKVNRYAKPTTKSDNLITADDDVVAVLTRELVNSVINPRIINWESNTLTVKSHCFTTLSTLYDANEFILSDAHGDIDKSSLPDNPKLQLYRKTINDTWHCLLENIDLFAAQVAIPTEDGDGKRQEIRSDYLLGKLVAQHSLVRAFVSLVDNRKPTSLKSKEASKRFNDLNWKYDCPYWQYVLLNGDKVVSGKTAVAFAGHFIAFMAGEKFTKEELKTLTERYRSMHPKAEQDNVKLPEPLF